MGKSETGRIGNALLWKLLERFGVQGVQFVLQIILARLLDPENYGVLSIMIIFTTLANVFVQNGFNTALIQNKDVTEEDYSSVFWVSLGIAGVLYILLFFTAPLIASFYEMPSIVAPFRVLALMLIPGAFNSVQLAKVSREMDFKKVFYSNIGGILVSGAVGILMAYMGGGLWALVAQTMLNVIVACIVMWATVKWRPRLVCRLERVKVLFSFGWKLLASSLVDTAYQDLQSLVVGKKYDKGVLGYFNRGKQFPQFLMNSVNGSVQSVILPAMSARQDDRAEVKALMRKSIMLGSYIVFPMMAGLAGIARPMVRLLLTEKWIACVPFLQIYCFTFAFYPIHTCNLQTINAMGRSDIFLKLEIIKKAIGISALIVVIWAFDSPVTIALTSVFTTVTGCFINAYPNKKLIGYSYFEQMKDILPAFLASLIMCVGVLAIGQLGLGTLLTLVVQIFSGVAIYLFLSMIAKLTPFMMLKELTVMYCSKKREEHE